MAIANLSSSSCLNSSNFSESPSQISVSSQKRMKQERNQSLHSEILENGVTLPESCSLGMSSNVASKLNQLAVASDNLHEPNCNKTLDDHSGTPKVKKTSIRATSKQVFPNIACLPAEDNIIYCFVLSVWDNIVGPQTVNVWKRKSRLKSMVLNDGKSNSKKTIRKQASVGSKREEDRDSNNSAVPPGPRKSISSKSKRSILRSHTILGVEDLSKIEETVELKGDFDGGCRSVQGKRLNLSSVVKYVTEHTVGLGEAGEWKANKMVLFLLAIPHQDILILSVRFYVIEDGVGVPYCLSAVIPIADEPRFHSVLNISAEAMYRITAKARLHITKDGLEAADHIRENLLELCTTLSSLNEASLRNYPLSTLAKIPDDRRFAEKMLTSHLQTMGTSLVIAESPSEANKVVMWLGQFLFDDEKSTSRIALSDVYWPHQPGISVQAVIKDSMGSVGLLTSKLLASKRPLTLIDLGSNSVRQMAPMNSHSKNSLETFRMELLALWHDLDHFPALSQSLFEPVEVAAPLVKKFLQEFDVLASCESSVRKTYLDAFLRSIHYTALAVIMWTRYEWRKTKTRKDLKSLLQSISSTFMLEEADLKLIIAQAERLETGFISSLIDKPSKA